MAYGQIILAHVFVFVITATLVTHARVLAFDIAWHALFLGSMVAMMGEDLAGGGRGSGWRSGLRSRLDQNGYRT